MTGRIAMAIFLALVSSSCRAPRTSSLSAALPNHSLTPGAVLNVTKDDICRPRYSHNVRRVSEGTKRAVYSSYNRSPNGEDCCKVDHLIPLELGGSNEIDNLWPEPSAGNWNAKAKDRLESRLKRLVCGGDIDLKTAQSAIASDWVAAYRKYAEPTR